MKRIAAIALVLVLAGCAGGDALTRTTATLALACKHAGVALTDLAVFRELKVLTSTQIATVDGAILVINPICKDGEFLDIDLALAAVERQLVVMAAMSMRDN